MEWHLFISRHAIWMNGVSSETPDISFIDAIQRRRLSPLAKASLSVMHECVKDVGEYQTVYASQHGELARTTELLNQMAAGDQVSPMSFSLAVLNATAGIHSIATGNHAPSSAVSAGQSTFTMGLLEAAMQAGSSNTPVLFVYADAPVPEIYGVTPAAADPLHAIAMLIHGQAADDRVEVQCTVSQTTVPASSSLPSFAFEHAWASKQDGSWSDGNHLFAWSFK